MPDFWRASGFHLLRRDAAGRLAVTDDFLRAYFLRPEMVPPEEACAAERELHAELVEAPRREVPPERIAALADPDARENYRVLLDFRDRLLAGGTVEATYHALFSEERVAVPPLFVDQMVHVILRNILDGTGDALRVRAAELLFRTQRITLQDGAVMAADDETVEMHAATGGFGDLGRLVVQAATPVRSVELDVLRPESADVYWERDERYDTVLDLTFARAGLDALARVLEAWVRHFLDVEVSIQPVQRIDDEKWVWHVGLDAEATALLNDLYEGRDVGEERLARLLSLFRLEFKDPSVMARGIAGRPVYLGMCMTADRRLRLKAQNLLVNLPLGERA